MRRLATLGVAAALVLTACAGDDADAEPEAVDDPEEEVDEPEDEDEEDVPEAVEIATDVGVTDDPCPAGVNPDNGCIYLGILTDLTGPFAGFGGPLVTAQEAFWQTVNEAGGITADGVDVAYDVDVTTYRHDTGYDPTEHSRLYEEIKPNILALAQTLGTPLTLAIMEDMKASDVVAAPATYASLWNFEDIVIESMANYCVETMNAVDYAMDTYDGISSVLAVGFAGDYGGDAAGGALLAAEAHGLEFAHVQTPPGADNQAEAIGQILAVQPDLVIVTTGPTEAAAIVGGAAAQGFTGRFIGSNPTWNPALLESPAGPAFEALYEVTSPLDNYETDSPGHEAMRQALGEPDDLNDGYTAGWIWQYPVQAALEAALAGGDLTRAGLRAAASQLTGVDYEGMIPEGGNYAGGAGAQSLQTTIGAPDPDTDIGVTTVQDWFVGPTAEAWEPQVCFELVE